MRTREERRTKKKGQETTIGKIIYSFLLFLPLIAIGVQCCYAIFNKNAYQSYYGETINESTNVNVSVNEMKANNIYYANIQKINTSSSYTNITFSVTSIKDLTTNIKYDMSIYNRLRFFKGSDTQIYTQLLPIDSGQPTTITENHVIEFTYNGLINSGTISDLIEFYQIEFNKDSFISEVFYYSIDRVQQSPLFNWATNSIIYTTTASTCTALSITTPFIPLLMSYWLIISIIYFLYDIALMLVWIIHKKIHELQESI